MRLLITILIFCCLLSCKEEAEHGLDQKTYNVLADHTSVITSLTSLANEAAVQKALHHSKSNGGYAPFAPLKRDLHPKLDDQEWAAFCVDQIFKDLDYPLGDTEGAGFRIKPDKSILIVHKKEALEKFEDLLELANRSLEEKHEDLINQKITPKK